MTTKIMKFGASWCPSCKLLSKELSDFTFMPIIEVDADVDEELCEKYNIRNLPTLLFLDDDDTVLFRNTGYMSKSAIMDRIRQLNLQNEVN